ncbi:MAG: ComEC/Rec2 family competence protein, partial [Candidatus Kapabacteria bacterium]|nr:ComEC/Rec2 family competence protein [Candidatus Kapabacteria bacterium]
MDNSNFISAESDESPTPYSRNRGYGIQRYPAVRLLVFILIGCGLQLSANLSWQIVFSFLVCALAGCVIALRVQSSQLRHWIIACSCCTVGMFLVVESNKRVVPTTQPFPVETDAVICGHVREVVSFDSTYVRCVVEGVVDAKPFQPIESSVLVVLPTAYGNRILTGTRVYCVASLRVPQPQYLPTEFSERQYCITKNILWIATAYANEIAIGSQEQSYYTFVESIRSWLDTRINTIFNAENRGFVKALLLGDKRELSLERREQFSITGTAHILAVSGLHVGIVAIIVFSLTGFVQNRTLRFFIYVFCVAAFIILSGMQPSALRAGVMAAVAGAIRLSQRQMFLLNVLAASIVLLLIADPSLLHSAGFQMSCASLLGISLVYHRFSWIAVRLGIPYRSVRYKLFGSVAMSLSATVVVAPIVGWYFAMYSFVSPIANILAIPLCTAGMICSIISILASIVSLWLGAFYANFTGFLFQCLEWFIRFCASQPLVSYSGLYAVHYAVIIGRLTVYCLYSTSFTHLYFRAGVSTILLLCCITVLDSDIVNAVFERKKYSVSVNRLREHVIALTLRDKQKRSFSSSDDAMVKYSLL